MLCKVLSDRRYIQRSRCSCAEIFRANFWRTALRTVEKHWICDLQRLGDSSNDQDNFKRLDDDWAVAYIRKKDKKSAVNQSTVWIIWNCVLQQYLDHQDSEFSINFWNSWVGFGPQTGIYTDTVVFIRRFWWWSVVRLHSTLRIGMI